MYMLQGNKLKNVTAEMRNDPAVKSKGYLLKRNTL